MEIADKNETDEYREDEEVAVNDEGQQYLTFMMDNEEYGVDILAVQEIRGWESATPIPNSPSHVKGVINLRGSIVPLFDLRQRFGLVEQEPNALTVSIILKLETDDSRREIGILVDAVSDVYSILDKQMKINPDVGESHNADYVSNLATIDGKTIILLDLTALLTFD